MPWSIAMNLTIPARVTQVNTQELNALVANGIAASIKELSSTVNLAKTGMNAFIFIEIISNLKKSWHN